MKKSRFLSSSLLLIIPFGLLLSGCSPSETPTVQSGEQSSSSEEAPAGETVVLETQYVSLTSAADLFDNIEGTKIGSIDPGTYVLAETDVSDPSWILLGEEAPDSSILVLGWVNSPDLQDVGNQISETENER